MLFPIFLFVIFFLVYIGLFQYNRCITEQSLRYALIRGKELSVAAADECEGILENFFMEALNKQYLFGENGEIICTVDYISAELVYVNNLPVPWLRIMDNKMEKRWQIHVSGEVDRWNPVDFIRICNRLKEE